MNTVSKQSKIPACKTQILLDYGAHGCVIRPPIVSHLKKSTSDNIKKTDVAKIFKKYNMYAREMTKLNMMKNLDPNNNFTISVKHFSKVKKRLINDCDDNIKNCLKYFSHNEDYYQIIMENAGTRIDKYEKKLHFDVFLQSFLRFIKGIQLLNQHNQVFNDLKPHNVMIKNKKLNLIDFGFIRNASDIYVKSNISNLQYLYKYYPPEFYIAYLYLSQNKIKDFETFINQYLMNIYSRHSIQYKIYDYNTYISQINDFFKYIIENKLKYDDVFNEILAHKVDVFGLYYIIYNINNRMIFTNHEDRDFMNYLMSICKNANPIERVSITELCEIVELKLKKSKSKKRKS